MKSKLYLFILLTGILMLAGCKKTGSADDKKEAPTNLLYSLEVWSLAENDSHIYHISWPHDYYVFSKEDGGRCRPLDSEDAKERSEITEEEFLYLVEYVSNLQQEAMQENSVPSYRIALSYYDENGENRYISAWGYDTFPEDFEEFIEKCNEIVGGDYLTIGDELQELSPEFLTEVFGVTDEDVRDGNLQDVIDTLELDIYDVTDYFVMSDKLDAYYARTKEAEIAPFRPIELYQTESTEEEYDAFVTAYLEKLGGGYQEVESNQDCLRSFGSSEGGRYFYLGRTMDLDELDIERPTEEGKPYGLILDAHMEGMVFTMDFVYSKDKKFMLLYDKNDPDMILPFVELEPEE